MRDPYKKINTLKNCAIKFRDSCQVFFVEAPERFHGAPVSINHIARFLLAGLAVLAGARVPISFR